MSHDAYRFTCPPPCEVHRTLLHPDLDNLDDGAAEEEEGWRHCTAAYTYPRTRAGAPRCTRTHIPVRSPTPPPRTPPRRPRQRAEDEEGRRVPLSLMHVHRGHLQRRAVCVLTRLPLCVSHPKSGGVARHPQRCKFLTSRTSRPRRGELPYWRGAPTRTHTKIFALPRGEKGRGQKNYARLFSTAPTGTQILELGKRGRESTAGGARGSRKAGARG
ncbi:hypothetical protein B0H14DRAFT_3784329 [Mycena olivaceomarginata]|nr:hypothetical protein B0H14DRAFT_3784329 [Mycena olivaceomarginata]